jgi:IS1 family transposase
MQHIANLALKIQSAAQARRSNPPWIDPMNVLPFNRQVAVISALTEGLSIRSTERLTGVHRDTIMRLGVRVGQGCARLHDRTMRGLHVPLIEMDELWAFIGKKQKRVRSDDLPEKGDAYTFLAMGAMDKAIISYWTGKRTSATAHQFVSDMHGRITNVPQISSDSFPAYEEVVRQVFGDRVHYAQIHKRVASEPPSPASRRYSPGHVISVSKRTVIGHPAGFQVSTSYVERLNLSVRMGQRRFTRLTNGFSKRLDHHAAAVSLFVSHYNLCRVHESLRVTPAMELGVTDHVWSVAELLEASALAPPEPPLIRHSMPFQVIEGGRRH